MIEHFTSLLDIIKTMNFISHMSTLYAVDSGPEFRLVASNERAKSFRSAPCNLIGKRMSEFLPKEFYDNEIYWCCND